MDKVGEAGGRFIVSSNADASVAAAAKRARLVCLPGFQTPSKAFSAIKAGADMLKLFPGEAASPAIARAVAAVILKSVPTVLVGAVGAHNIEQWADLPIAGFGIGSSHCKAGDAPADVAAKARAPIAALSACGWF